MALKIIVIGAGLIGPRHAQSVLSNPSTTLQALIDPSPTAQQTASALGTAYFSSVEALLASGNVPDAAIICTPNHTHVSIAQTLLDSNIHILLEKPISTTIASGKSLLHSAQLKPQTKLLVGHHRRFNPYVQKTKHLLATGSVGRVLAINGLWTLFKPDSYFTTPGSEWRKSRAAGGGVVPINLVHDIDILHYFFGPVTRVHAEGTAKQREGLDLSHDAEEGAALTLRFASGVVGTFLVCDATPSPYNFESGTGENPLVPKCDEGTGFYRIFGTEASLSVPDMTRWGYGGREKSWSEPLMKETFEVEEATPFDLQLRHFVDVVLKDEKPSCSAEDGLRALVVCEAVRKALDTGETVELEVDLL